MKIKIEVTQKHIDNGKSEDCYSCPIALAVSEHLHEYVEAHVMHGSVSFLPITGRDTVTKLPFEVRDFINEFDEGGEVEPFSFELFIPNRHLSAKEF